MPPALELIQLLQPHIGFREHRHQHEVAELLVTVNGHYRVRDDCGRELLASVGRAVLHPPGAAHVPLVRREADFTAYLLQWRHVPSLPAQSSRVFEDPAGRLLHGCAWLWELRRAAAMAVQMPAMPPPTTQTSVVRDSTGALPAGTVLSLMSIRRPPPPRAAD